LATVCGSIVDLGTGAFGGASDAACACTGVAEDPACSLVVKYYDERAILEDPVPVPLPAGEIVVDTCGRYRIAEATPPPSGRMAIVTTSRSADATWSTVAIGGPLAADDIVQFRARSLSAAMDVEWSEPASANLGGRTFSEAGVLVEVFFDGDVPVSGVTATVGGTVQSTTDFYFSDADQHLTTVDLTRDATGENGAALVINQPLTQYSGQGAEPRDCAWESFLGVQRPGWVLVREIGPTACP
jgi:hypothetical protein